MNKRINQEFKKYNRLIFYASILKHNGTPSLMLRKITTEKKLINDIAFKILQKGIYEFNGILIFRNPIIALNHLHQNGLVDFSVSDLFMPDFNPKNNKKF